jgi:hypothetical protein
MYLRDAPRRAPATARQEARSSVVVMAGRTSLPASDVDHRGIPHWRLGVGCGHIEARSNQSEWRME